MRPPIILSENGDILIFESAFAAAEYAEPIDVRNQEYVAFDCEGRQLSLRVFRKFGGPERVEIVEQDDQGVVPDQLCSLLRLHLIALGFESREVDGIALQDLVHLASTARRRR